MTNGLAVNYFALEPILIARLEEIDELVSVDGLPGISEVAELAQRADRAYVVYRGERAPGGDKNIAGNDQIVFQQWTVYVVVRTAAQNNGSTAMLKQAGQLLRLINNKLQAWRPSNEVSVLRRITPPNPVYLRGAALFPLSYEVRLVERS